MFQQNQNLKQRLIEGLNQIPEPWALTPLLGCYVTPDGHNWQVLRGESLSPSQQEVLARIATKVGGAV